MKPVLRLVEDDGTGVLHHLTGDLVSPVRGEAVHDEKIEALMSRAFDYEERLRKYSDGAHGVPVVEEAAELLGELATAIQEVRVESGRALHHVAAVVQQEIDR